MTMTLAGLSLALRLSPAFDFGVYATADTDHQDAILEAPLCLSVGVDLRRDRPSHLIHV